MSEATLPLTASGAKRRAVGVSITALAWRNLWRNKRRTGLMLAGITFSGLLVVLINSLQVGAFDMLVDNTVRFFTGHVQVQHPAFLDDPRMEHTVQGAATRVAALASREGVTAVAPRAQAFALVAASVDHDDVDPPATGALIIGIDRKREFGSIRHTVSDGRFIEAAGEAIAGTKLARNLHAGVGDEVAVLGNTADGSVAAMVVTIVGIFETGIAEIDRSQLLLNLEGFQEAFGMGDQVHSIAVTIADPKASGEVAAAVGDDSTRGVPWPELLPDIQQMIDLKFQTTYMIYALLLVLVTFSIVNAFIMTTFERTPEFGMLKALGMRPGAIVKMMSLEALWMAIVGIALTLAISGAITAVLGTVGISLGQAYAEMAGEYMLPDRIHPTFGYRSAVEFSVTILVATQVAALIPTVRLRRLKVVDALRAEE